MKFEDIFEEDNEENVNIIVELGVKFDKINRNKLKISKEDFINAVNDPRIQELLYCGNLQIQEDYNIDKSYMTQLFVDPNKKIGNVLSIDVEKNTALISIKKSIYDKYYDDIVLNNMVLLFAYFGNIEKGKELNGNIATNLKIIYAVFKERRLSAYN